MINILFQDETLLVVDKPAGLSVLPDGWEKDSTFLVQSLEEQFGPSTGPQCEPLGERAEQVIWVVHRLDKVTSGVMVFARSAESHRLLNLQFERRETHKVYHAILVGEPKWDQHTARHPLRLNVGHSHRTAVDHSKGKPSETSFRVLERFNGYALVEAAPATGRTHQIRVHAYALGYPLLGDSLYSAPATNLIARPALHALSLTFRHPVTGEMLTFTALYPDDFQSALTRLRMQKKRR